MLYLLTAMNALMAIGFFPAIPWIAGVGGHRHRLPDHSNRHRADGLRPKRAARLGAPFPSHRKAVPDDGQ